MVATVGGSKQKFKTLSSLLEEQKRLFKLYCAQIKDALLINSDVIAYVKEKCENRYDSLLTEMDRDSKIFYSRLEYLKVKLEICSAYFSDTAKCFKSKQSKSGCDLMYEKCLVNFFKFYDEKREMHNRFKQSQRKWLKTQDFILKSETEV